MILEKQISQENVWILFLICGYPETTISVAPPFNQTLIKLIILEKCPRTEYNNL
jgi:hypothetical protein